VEIAPGDFMAKAVFIIALLVAIWPSQVEAGTKFRVCTQNLARVGKAPFGRDKDSVSQQTDYLIDRIIQAKCDVIAVQEVYGKTKSEADAELRDFTEELSDQAETRFISMVGESQFDEIRNGFILKQSTAKILYAGSPPDGVLPKLNSLQRTRIATRRPYGLLLDVASTKRHVLLVDIHLKSKVGGFKDPTGLEFETVRMESSEQVRNFAAGLILENNKYSDLLTIILGDRNSKSGSATDAILQGKLTLEDFRKGCSVRPDLEPSCKPLHPSMFDPVIAPRTSRGSSKYRGQEELIDEIYVSSPYLDQLRAGKLNLDYGLVGEFFKGSDHKLVLIDLPL
jgi:hypothetical protein